MLIVRVNRATRRHALFGWWLHVRVLPTDYFRHETREIYTKTAEMIASSVTAN